MDSQLLLLGTLGAEELFGARNELPVVNNAVDTLRFFFSVQLFASLANPLEVESSMVCLAEVVQSTNQL